MTAMGIRWEGHTRIYIVPGGVKVNADSFIKLILGISWEGITQIYIVPSRVKVNADSFIKLILAKVVRPDFPRLYDDRAKDVILHMDSAPSHVALTAVYWLESHKVKWIPKLHWMANCPDLAPMDYAINANFKRLLKKSRARNNNGTGKGHPEGVEEDWC